MMEVVAEGGASMLGARHDTHIQMPTRPFDLPRETSQDKITLKTDNNSFTLQKCNVQG